MIIIPVASSLNWKYNRHSRVVSPLCQSFLVSHILLHEEYGNSTVLPFGRGGLPEMKSPLRNDSISSRFGRCLTTPMQQTVHWTVMLHPSIRHLPSGQTARPQITRRRPPKLLNRLWVIRQVSHCGKPQRTAALKKPLGFSASAKLASWLRPLGTPTIGFRPLDTGARRTDFGHRKSSTG